MVTKRFDRGAMQAGLKARHADSAATKNQGALDFETYFMTPTGVSLWTPDKSKEGKTSYFDIIPFQVGTDNYPWIKTEGGEWKQLLKDAWTYMLDVWIHKRVGADNATVICLSKSYRGECPVCQHMAELLEEARDNKEKRSKIFKEKAPQRRIMYNVIVRDQGGDQERKGVQVFEFAYSWMEKELQIKAEKTRTRGPIYYADPDVGKTIILKIIDKSSGGDTKWDVTVGFDDRVKPITDEELSGVVSLDTLIKVLDYDTFYKTYWQEDSKPAGRKAEASLPAQVTEGGAVEEGVQGDVESELTVEAEPGVCPFEGAVFGQDHLKYQECDKCQNEPSCGKRKEEILAAEKAASVQDQSKDVKPKPRPRPNRLAR